VNISIAVLGNRKTNLKCVSLQTYYRGADNSLVRPGMKQANVSVRMAWISFGA